MVVANDSVTSMEVYFSQGIMYTDLTMLFTAVVLNTILLVIFYTGKLNCFEISNILVFSSALVDNICILVYIFTDSNIHFLYSLFTPSVLPFLCKFRRYAIQVRLTGRTLMLAELFRHQTRKAIGSGLHIDHISCGIFIFPALVWFMALSSNIWTIILYECKMVNCWLNPEANHSHSLFAVNAPISLLNTDINSVRLGIIIHTSLAVGSPLLICLWFLLQRTLQYGPLSPNLPATGITGKPRSTFRLAIAFLLTTLLLSCPDQFSNLYLVYTGRPDAYKRIAGNQVIFAVASQTLMYLELVLKPLVCFTLHDKVRRTLLKACLRRFSEASVNANISPEKEMLYLTREFREPYIEESGKSPSKKCDLV